MTIYCNSFSQSAVYFLNDRILPVLTSQQKRIYAIVALALASLAAVYLIWRCSRETASYAPPCDSKEFRWAQMVMFKVYLHINGLYDEKRVVAKPKANVIQLEEDLGKKVEENILEHYYPTFFTNDLEGNEGSFPIPTVIFYKMSEKLGLNQTFESCDMRKKVCSIVLRAEKCWLNGLMDRYNNHPDERKNIAQYLAFIVNNNNDPISKDEIQDRLNHFVALMNVFYQSHGLSHNYVTDKVPQTYFKEIFK